MNRNYWVIYFMFLAVVFGGCSAMAGGMSHWPAFLITIGIAIPLKALNDLRKSKLPINEVCFYTVILTIFINLVWLHFTDPPLPY